MTSWKLAPNIALEKLKEQNHGQGNKELMPYCAVLKFDPRNIIAIEI